MRRHYKVIAKQDISVSKMNHNLNIKKGDIFNAQDIVVTVNKKEQRHLGIQLENGEIFAIERLAHLFEEIK